MMRQVTCDGKVLCEGIDYWMENGEPVFLFEPEAGDIIQLWDWTTPIGRYERWVFSDGKLSPLSDQDENVQCECSICKYRERVVPGSPCTLQGMRGPCKGIMTQVDE